MRHTFDNELAGDLPRFSSGRLLSVSFFLYCSLATFVSFAKPITPTVNTVVASWPVEAVNADIAATLQRVKWHVQQGQYPGNANLHYSQAQKILSRIPTDKREPVEFHYLQARLLQYQHRFIEAQLHLDKLLDLDPNHINGLLLKANLHLVVNDFELALNTCKDLLGVAELMVTTTCSLEAASYQEGKLATSYAVLTRLIQHSQFDKRDLVSGQASESHTWMLQIAADMALRLGHLDQADTWLSAKTVHQQPLSYVVQWAEVQRQLGRHEVIMEHLSAIVNRSEFKDDGLLIRLAMAEKALLSVPSKSTWGVLAKQRIELRIARQDDFHSADIAR